jgi:hypothetical protein
MMAWKIYYSQFGGEIEHSEHLMMFENKANEHKGKIDFIRVEKKDPSRPYFDKWIVSMFKGEETRANPSFQQEFKDKAEALAYARHYMKTH